MPRTTVADTNGLADVAFREEAAFIARAESISSDLARRIAQPAPFPRTQVVEVQLVLDRAIRLLRDYHDGSAACGR